MKEDKEETSPEITFEEEEVEMRVVGLYGELNDDNSKELAGSLLAYIHEANTATKPVLPVELVVSTGGGNVADMFALYDLLRILREGCPVATLGIGKVMSAGVLLLAAGTKGQRRIGKHCRIMIHHVLTSEQGSIADVEKTYWEAQAMEQLMFEAIANETSLTTAQLTKMVKDNTDKFFSAEEAVEMGIVDIIV